MDDNTTQNCVPGWPGYPYMPPAPPCCPTCHRPYYITAMRPWWQYPYYVTWNGVNTCVS
jgi:hypothetical protein